MNVRDSGVRSALVVVFHRVHGPGIRLIRRLLIHLGMVQKIDGRDEEAVARGAANSLPRLSVLCRQFLSAGAEEFNRHSKNIIHVR